VAERRTVASLNIFSVAQNRPDGECQKRRRRKKEEEPEAPEEP